VNLTQMFSYFLNSIRFLVCIPVALFINVSQDINEMPIKTAKKFKSLSNKKPLYRLMNGTIPTR
jgi:hypothetical protein